MSDRPRSREEEMVLKSPTVGWQRMCHTTTSTALLDVPQQPEEKTDQQSRLDMRNFITLLKQVEHVTDLHRSGLIL